MLCKFHLFTLSKNALLLEKKAPPMPTLPETAVEATLATEKGTRSMVVVVVVAAAAAAAGVRTGMRWRYPGAGKCIPRGGRESSSSSFWRRNVELKTFLKRSLSE